MKKFILAFLAIISICSEEIRAEAITVGAQAAGFRFTSEQIATVIDPADNVSGAYVKTIMAVASPSTHGCLEVGKTAPTSTTSSNKLIMGVWGFSGGSTYNSVTTFYLPPGYGLWAKAYNVSASNFLSMWISYDVYE